MVKVPYHQLTNQYYIKFKHLILDQKNHYIVVKPPIIHSESEYQIY